MGWWSASDAKSDTKAQSRVQQSASIPSQPHASASPSTQPPPPTSAPHDPDFYAAHPHLTPPSLPSNSTSSTAPHSSEQDEFDPTLPRTMSCRAAFDSAFYCSSLGGHFQDIYRYGQLRSCSEHWNDFWFCMRTKNSYSGQDVKQRMIQDRYREKEKRLKSGPNSEDIWAKRGPGEELVGAFSVPDEET